MVLEQIEDYDSKAPATDRADFLAYFRKQQLSTGVQMSTRELMNHLMNNLYAVTVYLR